MHTVPVSRVDQSDGNCECDDVAEHGITFRCCVLLGRGVALAAPPLQ